MTANLNGLHAVLEELGLAYQEWTQSNAKKYPQINLTALNGFFMKIMPVTSPRVSLASWFWIVSRWKEESTFYLPTNSKIRAMLWKTYLINDTTIQQMAMCSPAAHGLEDLSRSYWKQGASFQTELFFGTPAGDSRFYEDKMPSGSTMVKSSFLTSRK